MKMWKKILTSVLSSVMVFTLFAGNVCAAESTPTTTKEAYKYKVTFYAGNHGTLKQIENVSVKRGESVIQLPVVSATADMIVASGFEYGDKVLLTAQPTTVMAQSSKYYVKGFRLSGRDNNTASDKTAAENAIFDITGDTDYVVAYGILGDQVKYTVKYVHENGKKLAEDDVFYGNVGDKPVIAFKYIQGYNPKVYGLTKTLETDESKNVFEFVYTDATSPTIEEIVTEDVTYNETVITVNGGTTVVGGGTGGGATNVTGGGTGTGAGNEDANAAGGAGAEGTGEGTGEDNLIVDLDEETPLANIDAESNANGSMAPMALYIGMGLLAIIAIIAAVYITQKLKKKEEA